MAQWLSLSYWSGRFDAEDLSLESASARIVAGADGRRFLHDHVAAPLQMPHNPIGRYPGREGLQIMDAPSAAKAERERDALGDIARLGGLELFVGHPYRLEQTGNEGKNADQGSGDGGRRLTGK